MNLNYEEHCGYVNFLVESNWSLKEKRNTVHHVCFQRNQLLHSKEIEGERRGE